MTTRKHPVSSVYIPEDELENIPWGICIWCGCSHTQKHHMRYKPEVIVPMCDTCHGDFHEENWYDRKYHVFRRRKRRMRLEDMDNVLDNYDNKPSAIEKIERFTR